MITCELRVDGYTRIDHIEIDDGTVFIPAYANPLWVDMLFEMRDADDFAWLVNTLMKLAGITYFDVNDYVSLMRPNLSDVYMWRRPVSIDD